MRATLEDGSAVLQVQIYEAFGGVGFDIYRLDAWSPEVATLITPAMLPMQRFSSYEVVDPGIQNDRLYLYELRIVDATRRPLETAWTDALSVGRALVAEATVVQSSYDPLLGPCLGSIFQNTSSVQGEPPSIIGDGRYYQMYGHIVGPPSPMSSGSTTYVDEVVPMECSTLAVGSPTWSRLKTLYR